MYTEPKHPRHTELLTYRSPEHEVEYKAAHRLYLSGKMTTVTLAARRRKASADKAPKGFAALSPERVREISSMGGKAVPDEKRAFVVNRDLAVKAGRKGGNAIPAANRTFSRFPEKAAAAGHKGGTQREINRKAGLLK
jgi:general stress protein YciG